MEDLVVSEDFRERVWPAQSINDGAEAIDDATRDQKTDAEHADGWNTLEDFTDGCPAYANADDRRHPFGCVRPEQRFHDPDERANPDSDQSAVTTIASGNQREQRRVA